MNNVINVVIKRGNAFVSYKVKASTVSEVKKLASEISFSIYEIYVDEIPEHISYKLWDFDDMVKDAQS